VSLIGPDMNVLRVRELPSSVELIVESESGIESIYVPPSGLLRGESIRLRSRLGVSEVELQ